MNGDLPTQSTPVLDVRGLRVAFETEVGEVVAVRGVDLRVEAGQIMAIVGESGSGKSTAMAGAIALLDLETARVTADYLHVAMTQGDGGKRGKGRSRRSVGYIQQDAQAALDPVFTVGYQLVEVLRVREDLSRSEARRRAIDLLELVGIPDAELRFRQYPHQFSGGMCQRVAIAMAIASEPSLLVADEPTTALDVTVQAQILRLIRGLRADLGMSVVLITHDLGVVAEVADTVAVMYAGVIVEHGSVVDVFAHPKHPYTLGLMRSAPGASTRTPEGRLYQLPGRPISAGDAFSGCAFHDRCAFAQPACLEIPPPLVEVEPEHWSACLFSDKVGV